MIPPSVSYPNTKRKFLDFLKICSTKKMLLEHSRGTFLAFYVYLKCNRLLQNELKIQLLIHYAARYCFPSSPPLYFLNKVRLRLKSVVKATALLAQQHSAFFVFHIYFILFNLESTLRND
ncbi:hypothetical protein D1872_252310 [compost metagenome]